jgi:hypothetical protein
VFADAGTLRAMAELVQGMEQRVGELEDVLTRLSRWS